MLNNEQRYDVIAVAAVKNVPFGRSKCQVISMPFVEWNSAAEHCRKWAFQWPC